MLPWPLPHLLHSPWLLPLRGVLAELDWQQFPCHADWQALPPSLQALNQAGLPIGFADPAELADGNYELRIAQQGLVATRPDNWHDCFNALCWLAWPRTKAALNQQHVDELACQAGSLRSRARDAATLFDESGLVLAVADPTLAEALRIHDWPQLFQARRGDWGRLMEPWSVGHALMEKSLAPFKGIVAKVMLVAVTADWFELDHPTRLQWLDSQLAEAISRGQLQNPRALPPLPVLGIPSWWPEQTTDFYADETHFRRKRSVVHQR
ncbi:DUF3025 domain-containing protein [Chitinimonas viridis]|uniref:DUF3025 domain-containing protein n=1 Tax=Chitinimonas viridis TaxID=664880 RepID=A0ABT8B2X3_9NEIS|nr:DUF3025 domain-containing protein [Chitinimonas viridis]MDN3576579.1 DUF3025 domain-containing protein [Chitinimonas viridis]